MARTKADKEKVAWSGRVVAVQPRIRLMRSFDERHHSYQGYVLRVDGTYGEVSGEFQIAVGKAAHEKHRFRAGMEVNGLAVPAFTAASWFWCRSTEPSFQPGCTSVHPTVLVADSCLSADGLPDPPSGSAAKISLAFCLANDITHAFMFEHGPTVCRQTRGTPNGH